MSDKLEGDKSNALMGWLKDNPEAINMGMGFFKGLDESRQASALAPYEIAKTQYGYLTGVGPGKVSTPRKSSLDRLLQGYVTGSAMRQRNEMNKSIRDLMADAKKRQPAGVPNKPKDTTMDGGMSKDYAPVIKSGTEQLLAGDLIDYSKDMPGNQMQSTDPAIVEELRKREEAKNLQDRIMTVKNSPFMSPAGGRSY